MPFNYDQFAHVAGPGVLSKVDNFDPRQAGLRVDALTDPGTGFWFARQLEYIFPQVLRFTLPVLNAERLFPVDRSIPAGHKSYTRRIIEPLGQAEWMANAADDAPRSDAAAKERTFYIVPMKASYGWSIHDILHSQVGGQNLPNERGVAARRGIEEKHNKTFWEGDPAVRLFGVINYPYTPRYAFASALQDYSTPDDAIAALNAFANSIFSNTKETERPTVMVLPTDAFTYVTSTPRSTGSDMTIGEFFLKNNPFINKIEHAHELSDAGPGGIDLCYVYDPSPRTCQLVMPQPFTQLPVQERNYEFVVPCWSSTGGYYSMYPLASSIGELPKPTA